MGHCRVSSRVFCALQQVLVCICAVVSDSLLLHGLSRQEYWSGLPFPSSEVVGYVSQPGNLQDPGIKPISLLSPALAGKFFAIRTTWGTGFMVGLIATSKRAYAEGDLLGLLLPVPPSLWWAPANPHLHRRPSNTSREFWCSLLWGHCSFPLWFGVCKILFVPSKTGVSVSPSPVEAL